MCYIPIYKITRPSITCIMADIVIKNNPYKKSNPSTFIQVIHYISRNFFSKTTNRSDFFLIYSVFFSIRNGVPLK